MITDRQYDRLPEVLKLIVDNDQERAALRSPKVIVFEAAKAYADLQAERQNLRQIAKKSWGHNLNKNAPHAKRSDETPEDEMAP